MLRKNVKSLLEQLQVCIFAEIVFGVRCTLSFRVQVELKTTVRKDQCTMLDAVGYCQSVQSCVILNCTTSVHIYDFFFQECLYMLYSLGNLN